MIAEIRSEIYSFLKIRSHGSRGSVSVLSANTNTGNSAEKMIVSRRCSAAILSRRCDLNPRKTARSNEILYICEIMTR